MKRTVVAVLAITAAAVAAAVAAAGRKPGSPPVPEGAWELADRSTS